MKTRALSTYNKKRNFRLTPEPAGKLARSAGDPQFVIQKHAASHLHYDFRIEDHGALVSWAIPKGPSLDPQVKRLAMQTEDHPLSYANFEGVIPRGQYGGGQVIVWERGTFRNLSTHHGRPISITEGLERGHIAIELHGEKLHGGFALTRIGREHGKSSWLFVKMNDAEARPSEDIVAAAPQSVLTGRFVEELARSKSEKVWQSNRSPMPSWVAPMLATLTDRPFDRPGWLYEPKLDGERCLAFCEKSRVKLFTRNQKALNATYPELVAELEKRLKVPCILDGEIVAFRPGSQVSSFRELQRRMHLQNAGDVRRSPVKIFYYVFDLLYRGREDLRDLPLEARKKILEETVKPGAILRLNPFRMNGGTAYYQLACRENWEGLIAKRSDGRYLGGRSQEWIKFKCIREQEFVIGGYSDPQGSRDELGALLIGYYDGDRLKYAGKVGTGFDAESLAMLADKLKPLERKTMPFDAIDISRRGLHWTEPRLIAVVGFGEWTEEGKLRHPRFVGLRDDKDPREVTRERPKPVVASSGSNELSVGGKTLKISNLEKILYPQTGFTKGEVINYYIQVAEIMLPYLRKRPVTMKRYPNGVEEPFFYEKQAPAYRPSWLATYKMRDEKTGKVTQYGLVNDLPSLIWIANLACLEFHCLLAQAPAVDQPTQMVFDFDPGAPATLLEAIETSLELRKILDAAGLKSFPKTSGSKGLHVTVPLNVKTTYEQTQAFAHGAALLLEKQFPKKVVSNMRKALRPGKIFVDWSQNTRHKTTVCAYSLRAQPTPTVSTPVSWDELREALKTKDVSHLRFSPETVLARLKKIGDLYAPVQTLHQKLPVFRG